MNNQFTFTPAPMVPFRDAKVLDYCRKIKREDMEKSPNPDLKIKIVQDTFSLFVADFFTRIKMSDDLDQKLSVILPNPWPSAYANVAELCNRYRVSLRNVHTFNMDEWADEHGNVAPLSYKSGLGYAFVKHFYQNLDPDLRMPESQVHVFTNENYMHYSDMIDEIGGGGADVCYSAPGWPGHIAFVDPDTEEFKTDSIEEFLTMGSRFVTQHPLTIAENSLFPVFGSSGDVGAVPPCAVTIGPRDVAHSKEHFQMHSFTEASGTSWQRMISRLTLYGPVDLQCPSSIIQLFKGTVYVTEDIARPFGCNEEMDA